MIKIFRRDFFNLNTFILILIGIFFALLIGFYSINKINLQGNGSIEGLFIISYSGPTLSMIGNNIPLMMLWIVPQIYLVFILANFMEKDFVTCGVYIFTRIQNRMYWFLSKTFWLFIYTMLYYALQMLVTYLMGEFCGIPAYNSCGLLKIILSEFIILSLTSFTFIIFVNILSLKMGSVFSVTTYIFIYLGFLFSSFLIYTIKNEYSTDLLYLVKYFPSSQGFFTWHETKLLEGVYKIFSYSIIKGFNFIFTIFYLLIIDVIILIYGIKKIKKMDIL